MHGLHPWLRLSWGNSQLNANQQRYSEWLQVPQGSLLPSWFLQGDSLSFGNLQQVRRIKSGAEVPSLQD